MAEPNETIEKHTALHWCQENSTPERQDLIGEEPLSIRIQGNPYSVVMRTPGDEIAQVAGFCLGEGIVDAPEDINTIAFCDGSDSNVVTVTLTPSRKEKISDILDRRGYISQTSCGLCGKEIVQDLYQSLRPLSDTVRIDLRKGLECFEKLASLQPIRDKTRVAHAAAIYSADYRLLSAAEDVGRHNALDKAIGKLFLDGRLQEAGLLVLSSRISYELVQKAARARIPVIIAESRPTALAVALATELNMMLSCRANNTSLYVFCRSERLEN